MVFKNMPSEGPSLLTLQYPDIMGWRGRRLGSSTWRPVEQEMINAFGHLNGDRQWIHVDVERATRERGGPVAHGMLILSLMSAMTREIVSYEGVSHGYSYGFDRVRFLQPTPAGARIRLTETLTSVEPRGSGLKLSRDCVVEIQGDERPALICEWSLILFPSA